MLPLVANQRASATGILTAYRYYKTALGPAYSAHYVRTARQLAHLDYLRGNFAEAFGRLNELISHDEAVTAFAEDLIILVRRRSRQMETSRLLTLLNSAGAQGLANNVTIA
jgi:hypothetical protein